MGQIDLHMHSNISLDGEYSPKELAGLCAKSGLKAIALSDHNSVRGINGIKEAAVEYGIRVIPAVELDCVCRGVDLHLLGYGINSADERYRQIETDILEQMRAASAKCMEILHRMGIAFGTDAVMALARDGVVVGEMIAEAAMQDERNADNPLITPYLPGGPRSDNPYVNFYWDFCSQGKPAFCPVNYMSFEQAADLIQETGGFPVIAHPALTVKQDEAMIEYMVQCGVKGIEVYSSYHSAQDISSYKNLAVKYGLMETMGSDFHGKTKPAVKLGATGGEEGEAALLQQLAVCGI